MQRIIKYEAKAEQLQTGVLLIDLSFTIDEDTNIKVISSDNLKVINAVMCSNKSIKVMFEQSELQFDNITFVIELSK